jgi:hypothetical protein
MERERDIDREHGKRKRYIQRTWKEKEKERSI